MTLTITQRSMSLVVAALALTTIGAARQLPDRSADRLHNRSDDDRALIALDKTWGEANTAGDATALQEILADDLVASGPAGIVDKAVAIDQSVGLAKGRKEMSLTSDNFVIRWIGPDTAVMTHRSVLTYRPGRKTRSEEHYSLHVFTKRDGRWKVVATQFVPVEGSACK